ncbi:FCD domain-containing protein [Actinomycetospora lutea]|uniref:FadR/GntR family transcriptional regulator n=1 Tax=Actinomycetospora lutea TaxID=663604 RepID=UPI0023651F42|nr:FCD domain-containing protein [Actinomycetospora lutea]MDD7941011.1 FCD domain-containing protein [Actinomycetospora lutea]
MAAPLGDDRPEPAPGPVVARLRTLLDQGLSDGALRTGSKIPTERALSESLGASRGAVRAALAELEREGRITRHVGRGTFLAELGRDLALPPGANGPLQTSPAEIMSTRLVLEPEVAALAARHATQADIDHVEHCLRRGNATTTYEEFEAWDSALHRAIAAAAHNGLLLRLFDTMNAARDLPVWGNIKRRSATPERRRGYESCHGEIVTALVERDPDAAREHMRAHLVDVRTNLLGAL